MAPFQDLLSADSIRDNLHQGMSLSEALAGIVRGLERAFPDAICSILLLDQEGRHLQHGAALRLPPIFNETVHGFAIGPGIGCCGQAAYTRKRVIVEDITTHPNWAPFIDLARVAGIRASASEPILSSDGKRVLGTFAIYHTFPGAPSPAELFLMERGAALARAAIEAVN